MNKLINKYLTSMEFYVNFTLDENFEETIKSRFRDEFSYASFSEGEKMRIEILLIELLHKLGIDNEETWIIIDDVLEDLAVDKDLEI